MSIEKSLVISRELALPEEGVKAAIALLREGNTVPFIARYRKEATGSLTDENLRQLEERLSYLDNLEDRKKTVFRSLDEQKVDDPELREKIDLAMTLNEVEDLYRPYKPKKETRGSKARKAGLLPLSEYLLSDRTGNLMQEAKSYLAPGFDTPEKAVHGAMDILAESISDNANYRLYVKDIASRRGVVEVRKTKEADTDVFDHYDDYRRPLGALKGYNVLAINRGVKRKCLTRNLVLPEEEIVDHLLAFTFSARSPYAEINRKIALDSYRRLIHPSIENEIFASLFDRASEEAIESFRSTLRATLLVPPLKGRRVLGFDPGFAHGCKLAAVDEHGTVLATLVLPNPFMNERSRERALSLLEGIVRKEHIDTIALGNGHASRESDELLSELKKKDGLESLDVVIVSESGASIYSATALAQKEFPQYEPNIRSAISIARRLQDPLAELVKIPPMSIGVGQYQYDIDEKKLSESLGKVVEDVVNYVGVDVNSASAALLSYVSGINAKIADSIVRYKEKNGLIRSREELLDVPYLGPKAFLNCAGFLRIPESKEELDNTAVHPESYPIAKKILARYRKEELMALSEEDRRRLSDELSCGRETLDDILKELTSPTRDPRKEARTAKLRKDVKTLDDLKEGMILEGTIRNVTGFGFFVDLGIEINGLVHVSEIANRRVEHPEQYGRPGDIVRTKVLDVDRKRKRISLSMKGIQQPS